MKKLLLAVVLVLGLCGVAFGAAPSFVFPEPSIVYTEDLSSATDPNAIEPYHEISVGYMVEADTSSITYTITTNSGIANGSLTVVGTSAFMFDIKLELSSNESQTITATVRDGNNQTATMTTSIKAKEGTRPVVHVSGIKIKDVTDFWGEGTDVLDITLDADTKGTRKLEAIIAPDNADNKNVVWTSNNETVATVEDNGMITAQSAGTAIITATTEDGGFTATCNVTVTSLTAPVDPPIDINPTPITPDDPPITIDPSITIDLSGLGLINNNQLPLAEEQPVNLWIKAPLEATLSATGLPLGLALTADGNLAGIPIISEDGMLSFSVVVTARLPDGTSNSKHFTIDIVPQKADTNTGGGGGGGCNTGFFGMALSLFILAVIAKRR
jgi:hypothetical protein